MELTGILIDLFIIFTLAKLAGALATRIHQPAIVGEVLVGILVGPYALGWIGLPDASLVHHFDGDGEAARKALNVVLEVLAELGVIILLFFVGLETRVGDLLAVRGRAGLVGALGVALPFTFGFAFMWAIGSSSLEAAFVATAMVSTSIGITARVLGELGALRTQEARVILGAAVVDDILGLLLLAVVSGLDSGSFDPLELGLIALQTAIFVVFTIRLGTSLVRRYSVHLERVPVPNAPLAVAIVLVLGLSALASVIGLAAIIGAFLAGLMLAEAKEKYDLERQARPIYELLVPFFFVITGSKVDLRAFASLELLAIALGVTFLAVVGKLLAGRLASLGLPRRAGIVVGVGMVPRGEVGLVTASIGIGLGAISGELFSVVVLMSLATTLLAPPALVRLYRERRLKPEEAITTVEAPGLPEL